MTDLQIRNSAFAWLNEQAAIYGDVLPRELLASGFSFEDQRIPLISPQGIFKPKILQLPLTITTTTNSPYKDSFTYDGFLAYKYRGQNPAHRDNIGLRELMRRNIPLIYFHGVVPGKYLAVWPVYIVGDDPSNLTFKVAVDDINSIQTNEIADKLISNRTQLPVRKYITLRTKHRIHQQAFREKILAAYKSQCALCKLRHIELLDAAHIVPDSDPDGEPVVSNGISLCKLHHAAFDNFFLGIRPDYIVEVRQDILDEEDGPVLMHALQGMNNTQMILPISKADYPSVELLEKKYMQFRKAS